MIERPTNDGFAVSLTEKLSGYTVGFDGWHEEFDEEDEALEAFAFGLSDQCRLKVVKRGKMECAWIVEGRENDQWQEDSTTGLIFIPFWRKRNVEYRQNRVITNSEPGARGNPATPAATA
jgi:hypothetical protein